MLDCIYLIERNHKYMIRFDKTDGNTYLLSTRQILSIPRETAFSFFEKPENLIE